MHFSAETKASRKAGGTISTPMPLEILVTVRRIKIYYLSDSQPQIIRIYFFLMPSKLRPCGRRVYSRNAKRVLRELARAPHALNETGF